VTIRTAIIGFGTGGRVFHAPLVAADPRFALSAIVTGAAARASAALEEYPDAEIFATADELFAQGGYDLIIVTSPNATHAPLARRAIASGAAVVVDKPIGISSAEARSLLAEAHDAGVPLTVFQNRRWDGDFLTLADVIGSGELGDIHQFDSAFEWWSPELGDRWKDVATPAEGGGILFDLAPHLVDQALRLFGDIVDVHAELDSRRPGAASDDDSFLALTHATGVRTRLWMSAISPANRPRFRVVGSKAVFTSSGLDPQEPQSIAGMRPLDEGYGLHSDGRSAIIEGPDGVRAVPLLAGRHLAFYRALGDALIDGAALPVDPLDSIRGLEIIERARESA
jgi:predicted dehydrogenase